MNLTSKQIVSCNDCHKGLPLTVNDSHKGLSLTDTMGDKDNHTNPNNDAVYIIDLEWESISLGTSKSRPKKKVNLTR